MARPFRNSGARLACSIRAPLLLPVLFAFCGCAAGAPRSPGLSSTGSYGGATTPRAVRAGIRDQRMSDAVMRAAAAAGLPLVGDGRLAEVAGQLLATETPERHRVAPARLEALARRAGIVDVGLQLARVPAPTVSAGGESGSTAADGDAAAVAQAVFLRLVAGGATHFGLACDAARCVLVLSQRRVSLSPVPKVLPLGRRIVLRGTLEVPGQPFVEVEHPDGRRERFPAGVGPDFDVQVPTGPAGRYVVELHARETGLEQLAARVAVVVGDAAEQPGPDDSPEPRTRRGSSSHLAGPADELARRASAARRLQGLPPLLPHPALSEAAARAALDLRDGWVGGGPAEPRQAHRLRRAGFDPRLLLGHSARGRDVSAVHAWLMEQPALRASLLRPDMTHLGVGVVRDSDGHLVVTQLLARLAPPVDPPRAREELLQALNEARVARGAPPLQVAGELLEVAQRTADAVFAPPFAAEATLVGEANRALSAYTIAYARVTALLSSGDGLDALSGFEPALDPGVTHVGIGLARGDHPRLGVGRLAAVFALGYGR